MTGYEAENGKATGNPTDQLGSYCNNDGARQKMMALWLEFTLVNYDPGRVDTDKWPDNGIGVAC